MNEVVTSYAEAPNQSVTAGGVTNELVIYPDAGHGGIFQFHEQFVQTALDFLDRDVNISDRGERER
jgi:pimeloyl-ACP methyl ester carboxylesterase